MLPSFQATFLALALSLSIPVQAAVYRLTDNWQGDSFLPAFTHEAIADPTHGRVQYISESEARSLNLTYVTSSSSSNPHIILRADSRTVLYPSGPGRKSVRVQSRKQFGHNTVLVADILHMPEGCGTWPALWTTDVVDWPSRGEIDLVEGVNNQSPNKVTLHTTPGCSMQPGRDQTGYDVATDCNWQVNGNAGCGVGVNKPNSYGPQFNSIGGGIYALERTNTEIKAWFWPRNGGNVPSDVRNLGQQQINTGSWGTPVARFVSSSACDINSKFGPENVIINLTFCGDWAGSVYGSSGCPGTCVDFVNNNPSAFVNAYWDFRAIRMYGL